MEKIDLKDRKILYELDLNSRQSFRSIGRKVGLSKDVVASRVKKLIDGSIIKSFYTVIDYSKLGYFSFRIYLVFRQTTQEIEKEIIDYFVKDKLVFWVCKAQGPIDLEVAVWIKDIKDFDKFWERTLQKYWRYFSDQIFSAYLQFSNYKSSYLLGEDCKKEDRLKFDVIGLSREVKIDEFDFKILKFLAYNSRIKSSEIANRLGLNSITVSNRIKNLIKLDVIKGYRISIDFLKLGYKLYKVDIALIDYMKRQKLIDYLKLNPNLFVLTKTAGYADLEFDFVVEDITQLLHIMEDVKKKLPDTIKSYKYFFQPEIHKLVYIPEK